MCCKVIQNNGNVHGDYSDLLLSMCSIFIRNITALHHCWVLSLFLVLKACCIEASDLKSISVSLTRGALLGCRMLLWTPDQRLFLGAFVWIRWRRSCVVVDSRTAGFSGSSSMSRCTVGSPPPASGAQLLCNTVTVAACMVFTPPSA